MQVGELTSEKGTVAVLSAPANLHGPETSLDCRKGSVGELVVENSSAPEVAAGWANVGNVRPVGGGERGLPAGGEAAAVGEALTDEAVVLEVANDSIAGGLHESIPSTHQLCPQARQVYS